MRTSFLRGIIYPLGYEKRTKERGRGKLPISGETRKIRQTMCFRKTCVVSDRSALVRSARVLDFLKVRRGIRLRRSKRRLGASLPEFLSIVLDCVASRYLCLQSSKVLCGKISVLVLSSARVAKCCAGWSRW